MIITDNAVKIPILRPLLCNDKTETIAIARKIGTYEISIIKSPSCPFVPKHPATKSNLETIEREESKVNIKKIIENSVNNCKFIILQNP